MVPERQYLTTALWHSVGQATVEDVQREADRSGLITGTRDGRRMVTTRDVLNEERQVIDFARDGRGTCVPFAKHHDSFTRDWLNDDQKKAVKHIVESRDRVMLVRGAAGVGKTTLMQEAVEAIEGTGTKVFAFAPSADASRGTLRDAGFKDADTVARLLVDEKLQEQARGQLIWIDEAGLLSMKTMRQVFDLAEKIDARVLLSGDKSSTRLRRTRGGIAAARRRSRARCPPRSKKSSVSPASIRQAVRALAEGHAALGSSGSMISAGCRRFRKRSATSKWRPITWRQLRKTRPPWWFRRRMPKETASLLRFAARSKSRASLASTNAVFACFRMPTSRKRSGGIRSVTHGAGDVLVFHQNAKGFSRGERVNVTGEGELPLDQASRFQVFRESTLRLAPGDLVRITHNGRTADGKHGLRNGAIYNVREFDQDGNIVLDNGWTVGKNWGFLAYGYVTTSHASQGRTVDRVFVGQGSESFVASSREQFYVSASRARERVTVYTDDKEALLEAVKRSDDRLTATEFVNGIPQRQIEQLREQHREVTTRQQEREREELLYER